MTRNDTYAVLDQITGVVRTRRARQDEIALAVGRRTADDVLGVALATGARSGVLAIDMGDLSWSLATDRTSR